MKNLVSVIMSVYDEKEIWLRDSIESILKQTYKNIEFIIILDKPDNLKLRKVVYEYSNKDNRIIVVENKKNIGLPQSLNKAINISKGKYIARMDADDISFNNRIKIQVDYIEKNNFDLVFTNRLNIDEDKQKLKNESKLPKEKKVNKLLPLRNFITHPSVLVKTKVLKELGGYRNFCTSEDYDLWLRLLTNNKKIGLLDEPLILYRIRENSLSRKDKFKSFLITRYQKKLYKERINNDNDNFSKENLELFLKKNNYYDLNTKKKFDKSYKMYLEGIKLIKNNKIIKGSVTLSKSFYTYNKLIIFFIEILKYKILISI